MSGDTAVPFPPDANKTIPNNSMLSPLQQRRVEALSVAANLLKVSPGLFSGKGGVPSDREGAELVALANWILDGSNSDPTLPTGLEAGDSPELALPPGQLPPWVEKYFEPQPDDREPLPEPGASYSAICGARRKQGGLVWECELHPGHESDHDYSRQLGRPVADNPQA